MSVRGEQNNFLGFNDNPKRRTKPHSLGFNGNPKCFITHLISDGSQPRGPAQGSVPTQGTSRSFLGQRPDPRGESSTAAAAPGDELQTAPPGDSTDTQAQSDLQSMAAPFGQRPQLPRSPENKGSQELLHSSTQEAAFIGGMHLPQSTP